MALWRVRIAGSATSTNLNKFGVWVSRKTFAYALLQSTERTGRVKEASLEHHLFTRDRYLRRADGGLWKDSASLPQDGDTIHRIRKQAPDGSSNEAKLSPRSPRCG